MRARTPRRGATTAPLLLVLLVLANLSACLSAAPARQQHEETQPLPPWEAFPLPGFQKGVNFTAEFPGGYNSETSEQMLQGLPAYGINAIALVPYAAVRGDPPDLRLRIGGMESDAGVEALSRAAHRLGLTVLLKPHLFHPSRPAADTPEERARWFWRYRLFLEYYARLATRIHADVFCIGTELGLAPRDTGTWRALIARVRQLYPGPLVYAANWGEEFERIDFWDALDYIGLNNYYPLPDDLSAASVVERIERVTDRFRRPVIFTEVGFSTFRAPHRQPWDETASALAPQDQARAYEAVFRAFYRKPWLQGLYWWKVGTNGYGGPDDGSHTPWRKPAMEVVRTWYRDGGR